MSVVEQSCVSVILAMTEKAERGMTVKAREKEVATTELFDAKEKPTEGEVAKGKEAKQMIRLSERSVSILWILTISLMKKAW